MRLGDAGDSYDVEAISTGPWASTSRWASAACQKAGDRNLWTGILWQDDADAAGHGRVQKAGGTAAFVDAEHALDPTYAEKLGVNITDLLVSQPDTGEQALRSPTCSCARRGGRRGGRLGAALTPSGNRRRNGDSHMGLQAASVPALRKLTGNIKRSNTIVIFINQIRMKTASCS